MKVKDYFLSKEEFEIKETNIEGILKTSPIPKNLDAYYNSVNYISHHQDEKNLKTKIYKAFQKINLNYKRNILASEKGIQCSVLDYGCGAGEFLKHIENEYTTFGYEPNQDAISYAKGKTNKTKFYSDFSKVEENSLDIITLWHVFEHIENQTEVLEEFYKKLKPEGLLIIAVPNHKSYDAKKYGKHWAAFDVPRHIFHFSKKGMEKLMNNQHWKLINTKPLLLDAYYISFLSEKYKKRRFPWLRGAVSGAISNFKAVKSGEFSSLIYVIKKKIENRFLTHF